jgi:hypothetical protein
LDAITVPSVAAGSAVVLLIALARRRLSLGVVSVGVIAASIATTELFQHFLQRPILLAQGYRREDQSFPSGHATVAMALMCGLVMVVPYRFRGTAVFLGSVWAGGVGVATVTVSWHRPSDTVGADLIVIVYACVAVALLARWSKVREASLPTPAGRVLRGLLTGMYAAVALTAFTVAAVTAGTVVADADRSGTGAAILLAGRLLALSGSAAVAVTLMGLLRHLDIGAPTANTTREGSPHVEPGHAGVRRPSGA